MIETKRLEEGHKLTIHEDQTEGYVTAKHTDKVIDLGLTSAFRDVEDAFQYFTALENNIQTLITRNLKDYRTATIAVMTAEHYMKSRVQ